MDALHAHRQPGHEIFHKASLSLPSSSKQKRRPTLGKTISSSSSKSLAKSREVLAVLRSKDNVQSKSKAKSLKPTKKLLPGQRDMLNSDLQRVLGHPLTDTGTQEASQLPPITPQAMPPSDIIPLRHISSNLSGGLATNSTFPNSNYLYSAKAEIRKIMKQRTCFVDPIESSRPLYYRLLNGEHLLQTTDELDTVLEEQFLIGPMAMDDSSPPFMLDSLNLETASDDSNPDFTALEEPPSDLLDLMDGEHGWSPVKRPKLFPQKLY
ncbi:uncharacterized protein LOC135333520 isoform X2 [Halichondria panicea]|uniref:uncharacterized protein LOC135333520 isoform X2 n=1 Tax=Halichondria panicea TaxID=6063 RepID=UPI00312B3447